MMLSIFLCAHWPPIIFGKTSSGFLPTVLLLLFSHQVTSDCLQPHELKHSRLPCPSLSPRVCSNSRPLSQWCYLTILCCPLLLLPSIFSNIRVFSSELVLHIRWPKYWSFSFSISLLPMNIQGWFPLGLTGLLSLLSKGLSSVFSNTTMRKHQFFGSQPSLWSNSYIRTWLLEKP